MQASWMKYLGALGFVLVAAYQFMSGDHATAAISIGTALALAGITHAVVESASTPVPVATLMAPEPDSFAASEYHAAILEANGELRRLVQEATAATRQLTEAAARVEASAPRAPHLA